MKGHGWVRWFTAFPLKSLGVMIISIAGKIAPPIAIVGGILIIPSIAILLGLKIVRGEEHYHRYR